MRHRNNVVLNNEKMMATFACVYFAKIGPGVGDFDEKKLLGNDVTEFMEGKEHCLLLGGPFR